MTEPATASTTSYILTLSCRDEPGIVLAVAGFLASHGANITESEQYGDAGSTTFFMRVQFECADAVALDRLRDDFGPVAQRAQMTWRLVLAAERQRVLIMVSRFGHCLNDLLYRTGAGSLDIEIPAIVSNHPDLATMADHHDVPFHHVPVTPETRQDAEDRLMGLVDDLRIDLVVLARYMQILSVDLCKQLEGRAINIHHSMLPSFKGGSPYRQAHQRGVKLIGATAHYVTADLDEGPIIEQEVARVTHSMSVAAVTALGRDNESRALARAVRWHTENRVLLDGNRTVVFQ